MRTGTTIIQRKQSGNMLLVIIASIALIVVPVLVFLGSVGFYSFDKEKAQSVIEAASLVAANDLSRIVIDDPHFGLVSLSNHAPRDRGISTSCGDPLPAVGINTLTATIRQNLIIAHELGNPTMLELAKTDNDYLECTLRSLNSALADSLKERPRNIHLDIEGKRVEPYKDVVSFLRSSLPPGLQLESVQCSAGWLNDGSTSATPLPAPAKTARVTPEQTIAGQYKAFVDIPVDDCEFTFAGLGRTASLVRSTNFSDADGQHMNSIVKLECVLHRRTAGDGDSATAKISASACAQPFCMDDLCAKGILTLRFTGIQAPGLRAWRDFLDPKTFRDRSVASYTAIHGDYPTDSESRVVALPKDMVAGTAQQFSEHLYYWLRNGGTTPKLNSVLNMINETMHTAPGEICAFEFSRDGSISRRVLERDPLPRGVIADAQKQTISDTAVQILNPVVIFRDYVATLGTTYGGKHAGRPLNGLAVDIEIGGTNPSKASSDLSRMRTLNR